MIRGDILEAMGRMPEAELLTQKRTPHTATLPVPLGFGNRGGQREHDEEWSSDPNNPRTLSCTRFCADADPPSDVEHEKPSTIEEAAK